MSGNGISENLSLSTSTPFFSSEALMVSSHTFLSVFTAMVLPSRSLGVLIELPLGTIRSAQASFSVLPARTPWVMIWIGSFFDAAISSEVLFEKPIWLSPLTTAGVMAAPPSASCGLDRELLVLEEALVDAHVEGCDVRDRDHADLQRGGLVAAAATPAAAVTASGADRRTHRQQSDRHDPQLAHSLSLTRYENLPSGHVYP